MNESSKASHLNCYKCIKQASITPYGDHLGVMQGIKGRLSSLLHWSKQYDMRNLAQYNIEWADAQPETTPFKAKANGIKDHSFFKTLNIIKELRNFNKELNSRDRAHLVLAFKGLGRDKIQSIYSNYLNILSDSTLNHDVDDYIDAVKQGLDNEDLKNALLNPTAIRSVYNSVIGTAIENLIYDSSSAVADYGCYLLPIVETTFKFLTISLLWEGFGSFWVTCFIADIAIITLKNLIKGAWENKENGVAFSAYKALEKAWNKEVNNHNTFHPFIEAAFSSTLITVIWMLIDKLEEAAQVNTPYHALLQLGIKNYVFKYAIMNFGFNLKAQLQTNSFNSSSLLKCVLAGNIRGLCKNKLLDLIITPWKLPLASGLLSYNPLLSQTYLKEWWIKDVIAHNPIASAFLWKLREHPEKLISALYFLKELAIIGINNVTKSIEIVIIALLWPILKKLSEYKISFATVIVMISHLYQNPTILSHYSLSNSTLL
ncbi:MAG: hypothetical protein C5B43_04565 [Verrucomicrobia bacterium]|nr:MAG: hypothetical protein C5B43_04565 [Verrucomicrobiota bacterium]